VTDPAALLALGSTATLGVGISAVAALKGWHEWLELRRERIEKSGARGSGRGAELAQLRERVKRLETIANG
jgi:hypothetical protein